MAVADGQQVDRPSLGGPTDRLETRERREFRDQRARRRPELLERRELGRVRDAPEERGEVQVRTGYESSFEE
jgi:hypothetical protein